MKQNGLPVKVFPYSEGVSFLKISDSTRNKIYKDTVFVSIIDTSFVEFKGDWFNKIVINNYYVFYVKQNIDGYKLLYKDGKNRFKTFTIPANRFNSEEFDFDSFPIDFKIYSMHNYSLQLIDVDKKEDKDEIIYHFRTSDLFGLISIDFIISTNRGVLKIFVSYLSIVTNGVI